jgi:signal transduction histidine kinase
LQLFVEAGGTDLREVTRFNEAIDEALVESTNRYLWMMNKTRDQFLAILGHDLRNPLGAVLMSATLITSRNAGDKKNTWLATRIFNSAERMKRMVDDLLDLTRTRLGSGIPISPQPMNLGVLCREVLAELQAFHPDRRIELHTEGDLQGVWDSDRLAQVLSNLVGNALQHGARTEPIGVVARPEPEEVVFEVHNQGNFISRAQLVDIFEPMVRHPKGAPDKTSTSLGLGLHIAREIVLSHNGKVEVTSTESAGTTFTVRLPRPAVAAPAPPSPAEGPEQHDPAY